MRGGPDIAPFGVHVGEIVRHIDVGEGSVARVPLWIRWVGDSGITTGHNLDPRVEIAKPAARSGVRIGVDGTPANVETQPWGALASFELGVKDIVRRAMSLTLRVAER